MSERFLARKLAVIITPVLFSIGLSPDRPYDRQPPYLAGSAFSQEQLEQVSLARQFLDELNNRRFQNGLPQLAKDALLEKAAARRVGQMVAGNFSHLDNNGQRALIPILTELGAEYGKAYGEIVGRTTAADSQVVGELTDNFLGSCEHRAFFFHEGMEAVGVDGSRANDGRYYVAVVVKVDPQSLSSWPNC